MGKSTNHDMINSSLYLHKDEYAKIKAYCKSRGMSVNGLIKALLDRYMREVEKK